MSAPTDVLFLLQHHRIVSLAVFSFHPHNRLRQSSRPLTVALPCAADGAIHRICHQTKGQRAVALAAVIFQPCSLGYILVQVARTDVVMPTLDRAKIKSLKDTKPLTVCLLPTGA